MFKDNLRYFRKRANLSQQELADKVGISRSSIAMYERGEREPDFEGLEAIADILNVNMATLLGEEENQPTPKESELDNWFYSLAYDLTPSERLQVAAYIQGLKANRKG